MAIKVTQGAEGAQGPLILLSTGCLFHLPLRQVADIAAKAGYDGLEVIVSSPRIAPGPEMDEIDAMCPVRSLHAPFRQWSLWGGHLNAWRATTALANALPGTTNVTLHPPDSGMRDAIQYRWFSKASDLNHILDTRGRVGLSLENLPWPATPTFGRDPMQKLLETCREKRLGLTLDVCHLGVSGRDPLRALSVLPPDMIVNVHFSDARGHMEHLFPGQGDLPLNDFLKQLAALAYKGYLTVELQPGAFPPGPPEGLTTILKQLLAQVRGLVSGS
ncbi:MAG: sugar phosphate isomerase/epimerase [Desulfovibrionaceae bacterium]|nr:sugar phosphate isomerase/epimerase [Desulfovibrionaceae bacterium]